MQRYIEVQTALNIIDKYAKTVTENEKVIVDAVRDIVEIITPAAGVVPKSEVERLENTYNRAIRKIDNKTIATIRNAKQEVAREIFEEIEKICADFPLYGNQDTLILSERDFAELKKKYTDGEQYATIY